jgi:hypothetical protein
LRLVFLADEIPRELRRVIEFLNGQMSAEVLGIEVKQYVGEGVTTLVPTILGQTAEAETRKGRMPRSGRVWDSDSFFEALAASCPPAETAVARALYDWAGERGWKQVFGTGSSASWIPVLETDGRKYAPIALRDGRIRFRFGTRHLASRPPFDNPQQRLQMLEKINTISGVELKTDEIDKYPSVPLAQIADDPTALEKLETTLDWFQSTAATPTP